MKMAEMCDEARAKQVEEQINYDHLQKLEHMFHEADIDGGGGLDMEEFRKAMKKIMGDISDEDIDVIFMKVDTNCDGSVDWEEYLNYMLSEYRGKDNMLKSKMLPEFQPTMTSVSVAHAEEIVQIQFFPSQSRGIMEKLRKGAVRSPSGRFLTVSRDGILHYWSDTFKMLRTVYLDQTKRRHSLKLWVINMLCLPNINLLAIATTDQDIEFFDIGGSKCDRIFSLVDLDGCATAMDYWTDGCRGVFCVGDVKGNILIFTSTDVVMNGLFNIRGYIGGLARVPVQILMKAKTPSYKNFTVPALHGDWCQQIMYIPQLNLVASCTPADKTAMALTSLPLHNVGKTQSAQIVLRKGILCFDYSSELNILVTGGYEPLIRVWNPYVTSSPITHMKGHATAVTHIMINEQRNTIVSISKDKNIRVWDLLDHFCVQSIHGRNVPLGNFPISAAFYHQASNLLVCATYTLGLFFGAELSEAEIKSHEQPVCCALYNKNFKQAVSGCYSGIISVWDIMTGQKMMEFFTSRENPVEITAMAFDTPERRLITALKNESIKLWNFNNGACLMELPFEGRNEISCILYLNHKIYVSGWSKRVTCYLDTKDEHKLVDCKHWKTYHSDDILSMDSYRGKLLVTASCNGDIVLWNVSSGQAFCRFNASESPLVLLPKRVRSASLRAALPRKRPGVQRRRARPEQGRASLWSSASPALPGTSPHGLLPEWRGDPLAVASLEAAHRCEGPPAVFSVEVEGPAPNEDLKKGADAQGEGGKKRWAFSRTALPSGCPPLPRPASAASSHGRRPEAALPGSRDMPPQVGWSSEGGSKSSTFSHGLGVAESHVSRKEAPSWQEEVRACQVAVEKGGAAFAIQSTGNVRICSPTQPFLGAFGQPVQMARPATFLLAPSLPGGGQQVFRGPWLFWLAGSRAMCRWPWDQLSGLLGVSLGLPGTGSSWLFQVLFLSTCERGPHTAILLTSCADGYIYAWAVGSKGGMMGKFHGAHGRARDAVVVCTMSTDDSELVLFTGDSLGYIKIWDIMNYCTTAEEKDSVLDVSSEAPRERSYFYDLIPEYCRVPAKFQDHGITRQVHGGRVTSLVPPVCLSSWRGHLKNVVSIKYVERFRVILTSSHDCTIKLWMLSGRHVGTFGHSLWRLGVPPPEPPEPPEEIRRVGSLHTLKVLNEGRQPHWESTRSIVQTLSQQKRQQSLLMDFLHVGSSLSSDAASRMQEMIQKETRMAQFSEEQVEAAFQKWEESGKQASEILGHSYKPKVPRPLLKQLPEMKAYVGCRDQPRIYHCIQYTDLQPMVQPHVPDILAESQQVPAPAEQRTAKRTRRWSAFTGLIIKPTLKSYMMRKHALYIKE
ncbi:EF-hand calcium-binding domain-containing protein 8 [Varanus komodoensis]|uniref:EF-hand calcium-binding domain-containing protein 8 n=1 Tax=Varanus komodoensis TaxID=61221 RepID=UPI001CF7A11E|nr:EF-hand calcium-binding domain-containing protein 8 [Varanus komodoensis]